MALSVPWHVDASAGFGVTATVTVPSIAAGDIVYVVATNQNFDISSITSPHLTFAARTSFTSTYGYAYTAYAVASAALTNEVITANFKEGQNYGYVCAFGVRGANTTSPFDTNASIPKKELANYTPITGVSTSNANDILIGIYGDNPANHLGVGAGWTLASNPTTAAGYLMIEYQIVSATQSNITIPIGTNAGNEGGGVCDAIVQASGGGGTTITLAQKQPAWSGVAAPLQFQSALSAKAGNWNGQAPNVAEGTEIALGQRDWFWNGQAPNVAQGTELVLGQREWAWSAQAALLQFAAALSAKAFAWNGEAPAASLVMVLGQKGLAWTGRAFAIAGSIILTLGVRAWAWIPQGIGGIVTKTGVSVACAWPGWPMARHQVRQRTGVQMPGEREWLPESEGE